MAAFLYDLWLNLLGLAALPLVPLAALTRYREGLTERLGRIPATVQRLTSPLWVHAASVGEVLAAQPLIEVLKRDAPDLQVLMTTTSIAGRRAARERSGADAVMLLPADVPWIVGRVVERIRPRGLLLVETEIWPSLLRSVASHKIPTVLISGRVSPRSTSRYARVPWLIRPALECIQAFGMQTAADAERIIALGASPERVWVIGNMKFARAATPAPVTAGGGVANLIPDGRVVLIAASTHEGEERLALDACASLWNDFPSLLLVIAARRGERFSAVEDEIRASGQSYQRRTQLTSPISHDIRVLQLDTIGELLDLMPRARAVYVGGTFSDIGGHNVLEPAACGKPVSFGPDTSKIAGQAEVLLQAEAAVRVKSAAELAAHWRAVLADEALTEKMGASALKVVKAHAAVRERTMALVRAMVR